MIRRIVSTAALLALTATMSFAAQNATFVLRSGERVSGELTYTGGNDFKLNGRSYQQSDIAMIAFVQGDPNAAELNQLSGRGGAELERNAIVLRDGSVIFGKLYNISADGSTVTVNTTSTDRRDFSANDIARIYMNGGATAREVYADVIRGGNAPAAVATTGVTPGAVVVNGNQPWTDTGITVKKGERISFQTNGQIEIAPGAASSPDGFGGDTAARGTYPVAAMPAGGLIARVGNGAAFPIGSNNQQITMPAAGRLYLGINDSNFGDNSGFYSVSVVR
jgi:hypothetical protein